MVSTKADWLEPWQGKTVVCIASGPSLTPADVWRVREAALPTIVTNTTFRLAPWADALMAHDGRWWTVYRAEVEQVFEGRRLTCSPARIKGVQTLAGLLKYRAFGNSGAAAVSLAVFAGAAKVVMLGYDCQRTGGQTHWHGSHPQGLSDAKSMDSWPAKFAQLAAYAQRRGCRVVNASRQTALQCFERGDLACEL
jgi:hypothetical protein